MNGNESNTHRPDYTAEKYAAREFLDATFGDPREVSTRAAKAHRQTLDGHLETSHYRRPASAILMGPGIAYEVK